jgi:hypothetical protein
LAKFSETGPFNRNEYIVTYRHPPRSYRSLEFFPVNFLAKEIPGPPIVAEPFIRNASYVLQEVRAAVPGLAQVREQSASLSQIRTAKPTLTK